MSKNKDGNFTVRCIKERNPGIETTFGKIYKVKNGRLIYDDGTVSLHRYDTFEELNSFLEESQFELVEKPKKSELKEQVATLKEQIQLLNADTKRQKEMYDGLSDSYQDIAKTNNQLSNDLIRFKKENNQLKKNTKEDCNDIQELKDYNTDLHIKRIELELEKYLLRSKELQVAVDRRNKRIKLLQELINKKTFVPHVDFGSADGDKTVITQAIIKRADSLALRSLTNEMKLNQAIKMGFISYSTMKKMEENRIKKEKQLKAIRYIKDKKIAINIETQEQECEFIKLVCRVFGNNYSRDTLLFKLNHDKKFCMDIFMDKIEYADKEYYATRYWKIVKFKDLEEFAETIEG